MPFVTPFECVVEAEYVAQPTSAFSTSIALSLAAGPSLSISGPLLSKLHTETRLFVTLCDADWTFHRPTVKDGKKGVETLRDVLACPGVDGLLPDDEPML